jgi:hypothetical protein
VSAALVKDDSRDGERREIYAKKEKEKGKKK